MSISQADAQQLLADFGADGLLAMGVTSEQLVLIEEAARIEEAAASPTITELPGGGGTYDTATGQIITYDPLISTSFQQPGQVYPTTTSGQVDPDAPATLDGIAYPTYEEALDAQVVDPFLPKPPKPPLPLSGNLLKGPGEVISATVLFDYIGEASDLEFILTVGGSVDRSTAHFPSSGHQLTSLGVNAPQVVGVYEVRVQIFWRDELLASATATQLVEVRG